MESGKVTWPGWETLKLIGRGSFGSVYEIQRNVFGDVEKAALKVISIQQNADDIDEMYSDGYDDESITSTFQSHLRSIVAEYTLMRKMNGSANIVNCDDIRCIQHDDGLGWNIFIKMELLTPLKKALPAKIPEETVEKIAKDMCAALALCNKYDIIHRDIKPQNIFYSPNGDYKLGDFGVAKTMEKAMSGTKIGTDKYMAPEVFHYQPYDSRADLYSLGLVLYWLLNERRMPFLPLVPTKLDADMEEQAKMRRLNGENLPPPAHGSEKLKKIVLKACAFSPENRYESATQMLDDINRLHTPEPPTPPKPPEVPLEVQPEDPPKPSNMKWAVCSVVCIVLVGLLLLLFGTNKENDPCVSGHQWTDASCTAAKTCSVCNATEGAPLVHQWVAATCSNPRTCNLCGATEGEAAEHLWAYASCTTPKTCAVCNATEGDPLGHSWVDATCEMPNICSVCNATEGAALGHQWQEATSDKPKTCINCSATEGLSLNEYARQRTEQILNDASALAAQKQYRSAIQLLDDAWNRESIRECYDAASQYRKEFGIYNSSIFAAGKYNTIFILPGGTVGIIGENKYNELDANNWSQIVSVSAGDRHVVGLRSDGTVVSAGKNDVGQCEVTAWRNVVAISAGDTHTVGLLEDGTVVASRGYNKHKQCDVDVIMRNAGQRKVVSIAAGYVHTLALLENGTVVACGSNDNGECNVSGWTNIAAIYAGTNFSAGLKTDGTVVLTGLGTGNWNLSGWTDIVSLAAGDFYLIGIKADGTAVSVGLHDSNNPDYGQENVYGWTDIIYAAAGNNHTVALTSDGKIICTGSNEYGQCGYHGFKIYE